MDEATRNNPATADGAAATTADGLAASATDGSTSVTAGRPAPPVGPERFLHNMRALWVVDPATAMLVDAVEDDQRLTLEPARSGGWTAKRASAGGSATYLHSRYDPQADAERFVAGLEIEDKFCFVLQGMGLGYHARALVDQLQGEAFVLCIEPCLRTLATALMVTDIADALRQRKLVLLTGLDKNALHERLRRLGALIMLGAQFVRNPSAVRGFEEEHHALARLITDYVTYNRTALMTLMGNARITCQNIANNLPAYVRTEPIDRLRERFRGLPGVVISAGPSLSRNLEQLAGAQGRAVLCAVQTTLKPLLQRGIVPDFVTSLDFHEMSRKFFDNVEGLENVHLVAEPKATWHVIDEYPGPVSLLHSHFAELLLGPELAAREKLPDGATVAHLAFYLLRFLGCDPIIFVGQDLAFTGHVFYVPGVEIHRAWRSEINRFNTMEMKEWDRIVRNRPILRRLPGIDGGELYTDELLFTYWEQFVKDIAATPARVINATEGGAHLPGTEAMSLREALSRHCALPLPEHAQAARSEFHKCHLSVSSVERTGRAASELDARLEELQSVVERCTELLELLEELRDLTGDPDRFNRRLVRVDELRVLIHRNSRAYQIVNNATQAAEFRRYSADRRLGAARVTDPAERARRQLERDVAFITSIRDGADDVVKILGDARERFGGPAGKVPEDGTLSGRLREERTADEKAGASQEDES
jgi:hypothetical protein